MTYVGPNTVFTGTRHQVGQGAVKPASYLTNNEKIMSAYKLS